MQYTPQGVTIFYALSALGGFLFLAWLGWRIVKIMSAPDHVPEPPGD